MTARGVRNNNPTNMFDFDIPWNGLVTAENYHLQTDEVKAAFDAEKKNQPPMCVFETMVKGIRAAAVDITGKQEKKGINTLSKLIPIWAPSGHGGNRPDIYIGHVSKASGILPDQEYDFHQYEQAHGILRGMIDVENGPEGKKVTDAMITEGLRQAGITKQQQSVVTDPKVVVPAVTGIGGAVVVVKEGVEILESAKPFERAFDGPTGVYIGMAIAAVILGLTAWRVALWFRKNREG